MYRMLIKAVLAGSVMLSEGTAVAAVSAATTNPAPAAAQVQLRWQLVRNVFAPEAPQGRSLARFTLTNLSPAPLPAQGWSLYFNIVDGTVQGPLPGGLVAEQVAGQLYRIRPGAGFAGLAPGATLDIDYYHPSLVIKPSKIPTGPYLVFDRQPEAGHAIRNYQVTLMSRPEQLDTGSKVHAALVTPEMLFEKNAATADLPLSAVPPVFPTPLRLLTLPGSLRLTAMPRIEAPAALRAEAELARTLLQPHLAGKANEASQSLVLAIGAIEGQTSPEAYSLQIDEQGGILLTGASAAGVFRGLQSLRELLPPTPNGVVTLPALRVVDAPRFGYRGVQLDVARNFQSKETVLRMLDLMARYKLNKFHFHLTDDEGWRLAIAGLPELTDFGAVRAHTVSGAHHLQPAYGSGPDRRDPHGSGHYSRADYIAILRYAAARHIDVIPEIEMPGHARAAVKAMRYRHDRLARAGKPDAARYLLNDAADRSVYSSPQMYRDHVIDPGLDSSYAFISHVVADLVAMHKEAGVPLSTIHMGGDELPRGAWEQSPSSQARMKAAGLATTADLWDYFYGRVDSILKQHGLHASGWEEMGSRLNIVDGQDKLSPNPRFTKHGFDVWVWNNLRDAEDLAYRLANAGYGTVLAPVSHLYFDMAHNRNPEEPGVNWGAYIELDKVFSFIPYDFTRVPGVARTASSKEKLTDSGKANIRGLEATLFTEAVRERDLIDYLTMPRMLALAERAWASDPDWAREEDPSTAGRLHAAAWSIFANQLGKRLLPRLDAERSGVAYRIAPPGLKRENGAVLANHQLPGFVLRYTADGSEPGRDSAVVTGPITRKGSIRVAAFASDGRAGRSSVIDNP